MFQNIGSENLIVRKYDHIRQPDPIFHVAKLNDERIVSNVLDLSLTLIWSSIFKDLEGILQILPFNKI